MNPPSRPPLSVNKRPLFPCIFIHKTKQTFAHDVHKNCVEYHLLGWGIVYFVLYCGVDLPLKNPHLFFLPTSSSRTRTRTQHCVKLVDGVGFEVYPLYIICIYGWFS